MADVELLGLQIEYGPSTVPYSRPALRGLQIEYVGGAVPYSRPALRGLQLEYVYDPQTSNGIIQDGIVDPVISLADSAGVPLLSRVAPADILAYTEVSSNTNFDAEVKWRYFVVQYMHRVSGQIKNIIHRKNGSFWEGNLLLLATAATGFWDKRGFILRSVSGAELILLSTRFEDGESLVVTA